MPGPRSAELNGLNWQVQVDPLTLSMTSLPPTLPVLPEPDDVLDDPPQAASNMQAVATEMSHVKRFIDILRSPLAIASSWLAHKVSGSCSEATASTPVRPRGPSCFLSQLRRPFGKYLNKRHISSCLVAS